LQGKYYIDFRGTPYLEERYQDLVTTLLGTRPVAPPLGKPPANPQTTASTIKPPVLSEALTYEPIKILGIVVDEITQPRAKRGMNFLAFLLVRVSAVMMSPSYPTPPWRLSDRSL
jgi:hypothetical protein